MQHVLISSPTWCVLGLYLGMDGWYQLAFRESKTRRALGFATMFAGISAGIETNAYYCPFKIKFLKLHPWSVVEKSDLRGGGLTGLAFH